MVDRIVEIGEAGRHLSLYRGFLKVSEGPVDIGQVPLDDLGAVILSAPQATISRSVLAALAERNVPVVVCGANWHPISLSLPYAVHHQSAGIMQDQIEASQPLRKRCWQTLIKSKIVNHARVLEYHDKDADRIDELCRMAQRVRSGDPDNLEAQAARLYWPVLMGGGFRRDQAAEDENSLLNYGYTVLRAATARAICGAGLWPALGLHHRGRGNPFALADDLMEPFRPLVDSTVFELLVEHGVAPPLDPDVKRRLVGVLSLDLQGERGLSPVNNCLQRLAQSLAESFRDKRLALILPSLRPSGRLL